MADTQFDSALKQKVWAKGFFKEYVRDSGFKNYMGEDDNSIIQLVMDLKSKAGQNVTVQLVTRLVGDGVEDDALLAGNEESLGNFGHVVTVHMLRNAVRIGKYEQTASDIDILEAAKSMLKSWEMDKIRDTIIQRLMSPVIGGLTTYAAAVEADKDAWLVQNNPTTSNQRVLAGAAKSNTSSGDHSTSLGNIDATNDDLHQDIVSLMSRMARAADPHIRPVKVGQNTERYVLFAGSLPKRDYIANVSSVQAQADTRGEEHKLFAGGDYKWDNVIIHEIPEIPVIAGVGNGGIDVAPVFLCGAQAVLLAWGQEPQFPMDDFDYKSKKGVAVEEIRGIEKSTFNSFQHGVVTGYVSAVGD